MTLDESILVIILERRFVLLSITRSRHYPRAYRRLNEVTSCVAVFAVAHMLPALDRLDFVILGG